MAEYYGYKAPEQVNFGKSISNVAELFIDAEAKRAAKRESEQKSLDASRKKITELEQNDNQSQAELVGRGADKARTFILDLERKRKSGEITGAEFNRQMTNLNDSWDSYAFTTKNISEKDVEVAMRQRPGEDGTPPAGSYSEPFLAQIQSEILNTKDKDWSINEGNMYMADVNDPQANVNLKALSSIDNIIDNRVDVPTMVQANVSKMGTFQKEDGTTTIGGPTADPELYKQVRYDIVHSIVNENNPRGILSVLADNAGMHFDQYWTEAGKQEKLNAAVKREESLNGAMTPEQKTAFMSEYEKTNMVKYAPDKNGLYQPVLSKEMIDKAFKYVERTVDIQAGRTVSQDEPDKPTGGGPDDKDNIQDVSSVESNMISNVRSAWKVSDPNALRSASNDQYFFVYMPKSLGGGVSVFNKNPQKYQEAIDQYKKDLARYEKASETDKDKGKVKKPVKPKSVEPIKENIQGVDGLYPFFFGSGTVSMEKWSQELKRQRDADGGGTTTPKVKPGAADEIY